MAGLRILVTNTWLDARAGSELYVRDLTTALLARGHTPIAYSPVLGQVACDIRAATIPVVDDLDALGAPPDVIHGHHHVETLTALLRFPGVPAVSLCHGWLPWQEAPPIFPRIRRYVAVDETCRDRLVLEHGIPETDVRVLLNFVDLERFAPRASLPGRPARALVFSNAASEDGYLPVVREACARAGIALDVAGASSGRVAQAPETLLGAYDVVFAKARAALEAMAVGTAVVLCDAIGAGPLVTTAEFDQLRPLNFGIRALRAPVSVEHLVAELARYDAEDAARVSQRVRAEAGRDAAVDELVTIYREVIAEQAAAPPADLVVEAHAAARSLRRLAGVLAVATASRDQEVRAARAECARLTGALHKATEDHAGAAAEADAARAEAGRLAAAHAGLERAYAELRSAHAALQAEHAELAAARAELESTNASLAETRAALARDLGTAREELAYLNDSTTIRLRDRILATAGLGALVRAALRLGKLAATRLRSVGSAQPATRSIRQRT